jgi:hypothetical protein
MTNCDNYILLLLGAGAVIGVMGIFMWILDERCSAWKQQAEMLQHEAWNGKLGDDVIGFPNQER